MRAERILLSTKGLYSLPPILGVYTMNKHFEDSLYYAKRAGEHAKLGLVETTEPYATRLRERVGDEPEPDATRIEAVREDVTDLERRAAGQARERFERARETVTAYRSDETLER